VRRVFSILAVVLAASLYATTASAELIRITPTGLSPAEYEALGLPLDPAIIGAGGFRLTYHGGGDQTLFNPIELIIAIPTGAVAPPLTLSASSGFTSVSIDLGDTTTRYGGTWDTTTGFAGTFDSTTNPKVYDFIGFSPQGSDSQNYANWSGATGLTSWNLFVYAISFTPNIERGEWVEFTTTLSEGSYVIGYGDVVSKNPGESTPFTFAGLVQVPEPSSFSLLGLGLIGLLAASRVRRQKSLTAI